MADDVGASPAGASAPFPAGADADGYLVVARQDDVPPGTLRRVDYGSEPVVLANVGGRLHALADTCLHAGATLSEGMVRASSVVCPWHAWTYDPASGQVLMPRSTGLCIATYPVRVDGEGIAIGPRRGPAD
jgi:nitrite reductase/ring-hydroxylating ferredoxin subunit